MTIRIKRWLRFMIVFTGMLALLLNSCEKDINELEQYKKPSWLKGKLYTQINSVENMTQFSRAIELVGLDSLIDRSGVYTIFAPNNDAFNDYLTNAGYQTVEQVPMPELERIVKYHIIQNGWSRNQLQSLDVDGWIDPDSRTNNEPRGYKRQTLLREDNKKYYVRQVIIQGEAESNIVPRGKHNSSRIVYSDSRKYAPLYFDEFMRLSDIFSSDYSFFFDRSHDKGNIYYGNGKLLIREETNEDGKTEVKGEIFAENGFIYEIDQVVEPLLNAEQLMEKEYPDKSYSQFLSLIHLFSNFSYNENATLDQPGAETGLKVDSLFNLSYPDLVFDIQQEQTGPSRNLTSEKYSIRYQNGILAPSNEGMKALIDGVITSKSGLPHWSSFSNVPQQIKEIIVNTHMSEKPVYESDLVKGFINGEEDSVVVNSDNVIQQTMGSNCTFVGISKAIVPRVFSSVAGPVYLRPGFSFYMYAIEFAGVLPAIKRKNANYSFYILSNDVVGMGGDSSLTVEVIDETGFINVESYNRASEKFERRKRTEMSLRLLNHIGTKTPTGVPKKEFIPTLGGNFIVVNNENTPTTVTGGMESVFGYKGDSVIVVTQNKFQSFNFDGRNIPDNGNTYEINGWLRFPKSGIFSRMTAYPKFRSLLKKAGLLDDEVFYELLFLSEGEVYTVFAPSDSAITAYNNDTTNSNLNNLPKAELEKFLLYHFVKGDLIFTDGRKTESQYETERKHESSTAYNTVYSTLHLKPGIDKIDLVDGDGNVYHTVNEEEGKTNVMAAENIKGEDDVVDNFIITGVIHEVDQVLEHDK